MSEIDVDFQTETFELDDEASEIYTSDWEWSDGEGSVTLNVESIVGTMDAEVTVTPDSDDPEGGEGDEEAEKCWEFADDEDDHYVVLPTSADFEIKNHPNFVQVNFYVEDAVNLGGHFTQMTEHAYDSGVYATSMELVRR